MPSSDPEVASPPALRRHFAQAARLWAVSARHAREMACWLRRWLLTTGFVDPPWHRPLAQQVLLHWEACQRADELAQAQEAAGEANRQMFQIELRTVTVFVEDTSSDSESPSAGGEPAHPERRGAPLG